MKKCWITIITTILLIFSINLMFSVNSYAGTIINVTISQTAQADDMFYVFFDALDEQDAPIAGIEGENVSLSVGNQSFEPQVRSVAEANMGVGYVFAVDISKSLNDSQFSGVRSSLKQWVANLGANDYAAIVTFGEDVKILSDFTQDKAQLTRYADGLAATDMTTQLYNGIIKTLDIAKRQGGGLPLQRVVVILSDGMDDYPVGATLAEVSKKVSDSNVPVYVIGFEAKNNKTQLNELGVVARMSGGGLHLATSDNLAEGYANIYRRIQSGYIACATLDHIVANGSIQGVILMVERDGMTLTDGLDVRLSALPTSTMTQGQTDTPEPEHEPEVSTPVSASLPTPAVAPLPTPIKQPVKIPPETLHIVLIIAAVLIVIAAIIICTIALCNRGRKNRLENEEGRRRQAEAALDDAIFGGGLPTYDEHTQILNTDLIDATLLLNPQETSMRMLTLTDRVRGISHKAMLLSGGVAVGRDFGKNDIALDDAAITSCHCMFEYDNGALYLTDLDSTNGTYIVANKKPKKIEKHQRVKVSSGDIIKLGRTELAVNLSEYGWE